ncbi:hypothetical protein ABLN97_06295 [Mycobacterium tuberculosis]
MRIRSRRCVGAGAYRQVSGADGDFGTSFGSALPTQKRRMEAHLFLELMVTLLSCNPCRV